jgi:hypothetical protein
MGPLKHIKYSTVAATTLLITSKSVKVAIGCLTAGVFTDLDHIIEYGGYCRDFDTKWRWEEFFSGTYFDKKGTVNVYFHSWEFSLALWILVLATKQRQKKGKFYGIAVGYTLHLILDEIGNNLNHLGYFELYRWLVNWKQEKLIIS